jgi:hypothetical protein
MIGAVGTLSGGAGSTAGVESGTGGVVTLSGGAGGAEEVRTMDLSGGGGNGSGVGSGVVVGTLLGSLAVGTLEIRDAGGTLEITGALGSSSGLARFVSTVLSCLSASTIREWCERRVGGGILNSSDNILEAS